MPSLDFKRPETTEHASSIWHKLIPGAAITLQVLLESFLSAAFDNSECNGTPETIFRNLAFFVSFIVGLKSMKWSNFSSDENVGAMKKTSRKIKHALVNVGVVTCWLFAVSDFPLKCWVSGDKAKLVSTTRGFLVIAIQVFASLEIFDVDITDGDGEEGDVVNEETGLL